MSWDDATIYSAGKTNGILKQQVWSEILKRAQYEIAANTATVNIAWGNKIMLSDASHDAATNVGFKYALVDPATSGSNGLPTDVQVQNIVGTYFSQIVAATP